MRSAVRITSENTHLETWAPKRVETAGHAPAAGRLEKVDLRSHDFRLRDDLDNTVELRQVEDDAAAAKLVGQWIVAEGEAIVNASGRVIRLERARVSHVVDPVAELLDHRVVPIEEIVASAPGPDPDSGIDLTDEEFESFMRAARS